MHLIEQSGQPRPIGPTVFGKCWVSCNNGVYVILQKYGKGEGRGRRGSLQQSEFHFEACLFVTCFFGGGCVSLCVRFLPLLLGSHEMGRHKLPVIIMLLFSSSSFFKSNFWPGKMPACPKGCDTPVR